MRTADSEAGYRRWRTALPFTDEQIAQALDQEAGAAGNEWLRVKYGILARMARAGRVSANAYRQALPRLVATCSVPECGKVALYRYGAAGRCRAHKHVLTSGMSFSREIHTAKNDAVADTRNSIDIAQRARDRISHSRRNVTGKRQ